jgi:hypothetical protein
MSDIVELLKSPNFNNEINVLKIKYLSGSKGKLLFIPKLTSIDFSIIEGELFIALMDEAIKDNFNDWISSLYEKLKSKKTIDEVIDVYNKNVKSFIKLFQKSKEISREMIRGLFGELLELKKQLNTDLSQEEVLNGWHRPSPALHDFDYDNETIEIKTAGRSTREIRISNEFQLTAIGSKKLKLRVITLDLIKSDKDSVAQLYTEINNVLDDENKMSFAIKCYNDAFFPYMGPDEMPIKFKINEIDSFYYDVDQEKFPRISAENAEDNPTQGVMNGISGVKYKIDLSSIEKFKCL